MSAAPEIKPCAQCHGEGRVGYLDADGTPHTLDCGRCHGTGEEP